MSLHGPTSANEINVNIGKQLYTNKDDNFDLIEFDFVREIRRGLKMVRNLMYVWDEMFFLFEKCNPDD